MRNRYPSRSASIYRAMLRGAALLVPYSEREEWLMEWGSELWHFDTSCRTAHDSFAQSSGSMARFCLGSFRDAMWLRRNHPDLRRDNRLWFRSPLQCMSSLVALAILTWLIALLQSILRPPYTGRQFMLGQLLVLGTALLLVRISTPFGLGEYPVASDSPARGSPFYWLLFLGAKVALVWVIVFCGTLDLGPIIACAGMRPHATLIGYVLGFRWVLVDQRRRCPVCLRLLTKPVRIGQASHIMLEWYGTELICSKGHGLLHIPETPTSSFSAQRWLHLDCSWRGLFS